MPVLGVSPKFYDDSTLLIFFSAHPTLTRHSAPEVVANFKRRVPPRLPKPRKRDADPAPGTAYPSPRSNVIGPISLSNTSAPPPNTRNGNGRARGYSGSGGSYPPLNQTGAPTAGWGSGYPMNAGGPRGGGPLPPLTVPSDPPPLYGHQGHMGPISPAEDTPPSTANGYPPVPSYSSHANRELMGGPPPSHHYPYAVAEPQSASTAWSSPNNSTPSHSASLSSLLNLPTGHRTLVGHLDRTRCLMSLRSALSTLPRVSIAQTVAGPIQVIQRYLDMTRLLLPRRMLDLTTRDRTRAIIVACLPRDHVLAHLTGRPLVLMVLLP